MKVSGPRIKEARIAEPKKESGPVRIDVPTGHRKESAARPRDTFQAGPSHGGTRAGNLRLGESHADNISKGPRGDSGAPSTVQAGSPHTLFNRLFPKPQKPAAPGPTQHEPGATRGGIGTNGGRNRFGEGYGGIVSLSETRKPDAGFRAGNGNPGIVPPGTSAPVTGGSTGSKPKTLLSKEALQDLKSPELTPRLVNKLSKATTLQKVDKLTRFLSEGLRGTIMMMARRSSDDSRYGGSSADNLQA